MNNIYRTEGSRDALAAFMDYVLKMWPYPFEAKFMDTRFGKTHIVTAGQKNSPVLMLLHGSASNLLSFGGDIPKYMGDYFVVVPDLPGEAGKSAPCRPSWRNLDYVFWMDDLMDSMEISEATILGVSLGGWIAAKYAAHRPSRVHKLILNAPGGLAPARISIIAKSMLYSMRKEYGTGKMKRVVFGEEEVAPEVAMFFDLIQKHLIPRFGSPPVLSDSEFQSITAHVCMIAGEKDAFFNTAKAAARLKRVLPEAEIQIISQGQHGLIELGDRIMEFLKS